MKYDPDVHHRRSMRLAGWDYATPGAYFVTICTYQREPVLECSVIADIVRREWVALPGRFPSVALDEFIAMPNHVHGIILITAPDAVGAQQAGAPTGGPTLGKIIRAFKSLSAIEANRALDRTERPFWQRNYWEHVVRDDDDLNRIRQYIMDNPRKWAEDPDNPANRGVGALACRAPRRLPHLRRRDQPIHPASTRRLPEPPG